MIKLNMWLLKFFLDVEFLFLHRRFPYTTIIPHSTRKTFINIFTKHIKLVINTDDFWIFIIIFVESIHLDNDFLNNMCLT